MSFRRLTPRFREKVWGSTRLAPWFDDTDRKIGEVWFEGASEFPLLVKFLFTSEKLSIQVHPDDGYAAKVENSRGKTEMWHILAAEPGAKIAAGFRHSLTADRLREVSLSGEIEEMLEWFDAAPGDTFFIPAGTVHAIGGGLALCEIQQRSDVTYRLYDYGRPRELHLERAADISQLGPYAARQSAKDGVLVSCDYFTTKLVRVENLRTIPLHTQIPEMWIALDGSGEIAGHPFKAGQAWLWSREEGEPETPSFEIHGRARFLRTFAGPLDSGNDGEA